VLTATVSIAENYKASVCSLSRAQGNNLYWGMAGRPHVGKEQDMEYISDLITVKFLQYIWNL
jgi:hypothetical protein